MLLAAVADEAKDDEIEDRVEAVKTTFERFTSNQLITQTNHLESLLGEKAVRQLDKWMALTRTAITTAANSTVMQIVEPTTINPAGIPEPERLSGICSRASGFRMERLGDFRNLAHGSNRERAEGSADTKIGVLLHRHSPRRPGECQRLRS